jgi:hypothetical protein
LIIWRICREIQAYPQKLLSHKAAAKTRPIRHQRRRYDVIRVIQVAEYDINRLSRKTQGHQQARRSKHWVKNLRNLHDKRRTKNKETRQ